MAQAGKANLHHQQKGISENWKAPTNSLSRATEIYSIDNAEDITQHIIYFLHWHSNLMLKQAESIECKVYIEYSHCTWKRCAVEISTEKVMDSGREREIERGVLSFTPF